MAPSVNVPFAKSTPADWVQRPAFLARTSVFADDATKLVARAIQSPGFVLLHICDFCSAYFGSKNPVNRGTIEKMMADLEMPPGVHYKGAPNSRRCSFSGSGSGLRTEEGAVGG